LTLARTAKASHKNCGNAEAGNNKMLRIHKIKLHDKVRALEMLAKKLLGTVTPQYKCVVNRVPIAGLL